MPLCAPQVVAKPAYLRDVVGDDGGGDFIHFKAAVGFGDFDAAQSQFASLLQQIARNREILVLNFFRVGQDFVDGEFFRRLPDQLVLFGEIFGRENFVGAAGFEQEAAAGDFGVGSAVVAAIRTFQPRRALRLTKEILSAKRLRITL